jgi:GNAT superfamily N-acetyltransferase
VTQASAGGVRLRDMRPEDIGGGLRLCRLAGWNQRAEDWQALLASGRIRVALRGATIVGSGGAVQYGSQLAWVAMILVDPEERGQGIATRLVEDILERRHDFEIMGLDATPEGAPVYARHGFTDRSGFARMQRPADTGSAASPGSRAVVALTKADLAAVAERDRVVFGADRMPVLRWALDQAPEYAWRLEAAGSLPSYVFGRHGHRTEHLGPLVAEDGEAAASLLAAALASAPGRCFTIDVPDRPAWLQRLGQLGFATQRVFRRMLLEDAPAPGEPGQLFAITGPEFG